MSAPSEDMRLTDIDIEVLRALLFGLELREIGDKWQFVGSWQLPHSSGVESGVVARLLHFGFISCGIDSRAVITNAGRERIFQWSKEAVSFTSKLLNEKE
jgi:hypothetical protein